jgi:hypothetical protein
VADSVISVKLEFMKKITPSLLCHLVVWMRYTVKDLETPQLF